ncbi:MAG: cryptochrome/photolyase family protein [Synechocystis sp.]|nr:cryptochrome/photolyase family protein [Synechocystis sp.]
MTIGIWILGDQLWLGQAALTAHQDHRSQVPVLMIESSDFARQRPYHRQKLVLVWSAMRHFAQALQHHGWSVSYEISEDFLTPLHQWITTHGITELQLMTPGDRPFEAWLRSLSLPCELTLLPNNHFLWSRTAFAAWAQGRKRLLLEDFYREGRKRWQILMADNKPLGDRWNFDQENRKPPKKTLVPPPPLSFPPDSITQQVIERVKQLNLPGYGQLAGFQWGVTRSDALQVLDHFVNSGLGQFGTYQDAMVTGQQTLWHSLTSPYLNLGLLTPLEVIEAIAQAMTADAIPLNNVEGFIRQVLGWREYMQGIYQWVDDDYVQRNWFGHDLPLPGFYWQGSQTEMHCLSTVLGQVEATGYAHHIQRLMILSNFALIVGVNPQELEAWFHAVFIDAYDWVMQTNVLGMGQFADGGLLASKPYASSANYVNKMSDYCSQCRYNPKARTGKDACPFNYFYWDFLSRHQEKLQKTGRMGLILANLKRIDPAEMGTMQDLAQQWRREHLTTAIAD